VAGFCFVKLKELMKNPTPPNYNLIAVLDFCAQPDVRFEMENSQIVFLPPIFRKKSSASGDEYIDATGECDLCMSLDGRYFHFYNRLDQEHIFAFRYIPLSYLANKSGR
jgi:hypothetical protein